MSSGKEIVLQGKSKWSSRQSRQRQSGSSHHSIITGITKEAPHTLSKQTTVVQINLRPPGQQLQTQTSLKMVELREQPRQIGATSNYRHMPAHIADVQSVHELVIDPSRILSFKKGDLNLMHTRAVYCDVAGAHHKVGDYPLILKSFDCLDESVYSMKIHETGVMLNNRHHPNLVNVLRVFKSPPKDSFSYRIIYILLECSDKGSLHDLCLSGGRALRPSNRQLFRYFAGVAKGSTV